MSRNASPFGPGQRASALAPAGAMEGRDGLAALIGLKGLSDRALAKVWAAATGESAQQAIKKGIVPLFIRIS